MKKRTNLLLCSIILFTSLHAQDMGFRTTDIGGEYQWNPRGSVYNLHLAFNSKLNHSFQLRIGYNNYDYLMEKGHAWGGGIGYRYYFNPFPHKFFIGARADVWKMKVSWSRDYPPYGGSTTVTALQPAMEGGYTFVINDQLYITPYAAAGPQLTLQSKGSMAVSFGKDFLPIIGISAGVRL
jgi:hypothetical protein